MTKQKWEKSEFRTINSIEKSKQSKTHSHLSMSSLTAMPLLFSIAFCNRVQYISHQAPCVLFSCPNHETRDKNNFSICSRRKISSVKMYRNRFVLQTIRLRLLIAPFNIFLNAVPSTTISGFKLWIAFILMQYDSRQNTCVISNYLINDSGSWYTNVFRAIRHP